MFPDDWELSSSHLERSAQPFDAAAVETFYARTREDYGLLHGDQLLLYVLRVVLNLSKLGLRQKPPIREDAQRMSSDDT